MNFIKVKPKKTYIKKHRTNITIKRSNKVVQALSLPTCANLNPRSMNNKKEQFKTLVEEEDLDVIFISETHEQLSKPLAETLVMENFTVISNVHQRRGKGGRPTLVINNTNIMFRI